MSKNLTKRDETLTRGDSHTFRLTFTNGVGAEISIVGWTIYLTAKRRIEDTDEEAILQKTITDHSDFDPEHGVGGIILEKTDTEDLPLGTFYYDIQVKTNGGKIYTPMIGQLTIKGDVTRRTT